jgi:hypothetical protein
MPKARPLVAVWPVVAVQFVLVFIGVAPPSLLSCAGLASAVVRCFVTWPFGTCGVAG